MNWILNQWQYTLMTSIWFRSGMLHKGRQTKRTWHAALITIREVFYCFHSFHSIYPTKKSGDRQRKQVFSTTNSTIVPWCGVSNSSCLKIVSLFPTTLIFHCLFGRVPVYISGIIKHTQNPLLVAARKTFPLWKFFIENERDAWVGYRRTHETYLF